MEVTEELSVKELVSKVPHYTTPLMCEGEVVGYPYCLRTAVSLYGKEVISEDQGIYQLFYKDNLVYIGMSKNLRKRLLYHMQDEDKVFDAVLIYPMPGASIKKILDIEANMIKTYTPALNISHLCKN